MMRGAIATALSTACLLLCGCPPSEVGGCDKDTDCKGERICVQRACIYPRGQGRPVTVPPGMQPDPVTPRPPLPPEVPPPPPADPPPSPPPPATPTPTPSNSGEVHSGSAPTGRNKCGCAPDDLMCNLRCAQGDNPAAPHFPKPQVPPSPAPF